MTRRLSLPRAGALLLAGALVFLLAGDRGLTAVSMGIDPLDVLDLQVKPNVIVFLDSSGTFKESPAETGATPPWAGGDWPDSKLYQMKQVFKQLVQDNQSKVSFMFGQFTQANSKLQTTNATTSTANGASRFFYTTTSTASPSMTTTELSLTRADATDTTGRGLQSWQDIRGGWNTLYYRENGVTCASSVTAQFYTTGASLATALQNSMNACTGRGATPNRYYVTYNNAAGTFTFGRCTGANLPVAGCVAGGNVQFQIRWNDTPNNIAGALASSGTTTLSTNAVTSAAAYVMLRRDTGDDETLTVNTVPVTTYWLSANRFFNGDTFDVLSNGTLCGPRGVPVPTNPPSVKLQLVPNCGGSPSVPPVTFTWSGGIFGGNSISCNGYQVRVPLVACNTTANQVTLAAPIIEREAPLAADGLTLQGYTESQDGRFTTTSNPPTTPGGISADGSTPLAPAMQQIAGIFNTLWTTGQNPGPPVLGPISGHLNPKEKTIVLLVTDASGNDATCSHGTETEMLEETAYWAQTLYDPIVGGVQTPSGYLTTGSDPGSSVTTYVIGFGNATNMLNWIAWGGSGMQRATTTASTGFPHWATPPTQADRDLCQTCVDAFLVPDAATLADTLQKIINQGATSGEFSAQQSLTDSIYELAGDAPQATAPAPWSPFNPRNRYDPLVPHRFVSTFSLPLFTGQIRAYTQDGPDSLASTDASCLAGAACRRWSANDKLANRVSTGMAAACVANATAVVSTGQCPFSFLWNGADITNVGSRAGVGIRRRIFTTSQNGVFGPTVAQLVAGQSPFRVALWPPQTAAIPRAVAPANDTGMGLFDVELGLPSDTPPSIDTAFLNLRTKFKACMGNNLPANCPAMTTTSGFTLAQMQRARREARETLLGFLAGATWVPDASNNPKRVTTTSAGYTAKEVLYMARSAILAESTLATPAVIGPPQEELPAATTWTPEYKLYRDGPRDHTDPTREPDGVSSVNATVVRAGFGLRNPDSDANNVPIGTVQGRVFYQNDARAMKPVMSVLYTGSNLALHAFRAGPNGAVATNVTTPCDVNQATQEFTTKDCGGEELWAYVPYDELGKLQNRYVNNPQKRDPHDYVIARAIRFSDIFVPTPGTASNPDNTPVTMTVGPASLGPIAGIWRKVLFVGRGKGGKYLTAIDVTSPGMFTDRALSDNIVGPIFLWSRGNPDTTNGQTTANGGVRSHDQLDYDNYLTMGETWSVPAVAFVDRATMRADDPTQKATATARKPTGVDFVMYAGSGYGAAGEGTSFYSIDPLTGDIITRVDVDGATNLAAYPGLVRTGMPYANAIVANPVVFNASRYLYAQGGVASPNVAAAPARRVYVADLWGRQWKFLTAAPDVPLPVADLGADQPVATANSLLGLPPNDPNTKPYVYTTSGNENRAPGPFKNFGFRDEGSDTSLSVLAAVAQNGINVYPPSQGLFVIPFEPAFRGTVQPATAYSDTAAGAGRVFFGGTRFNPPNSTYAPPVPPYPCRSSFDSILYALGAQSGLAAYDLAYGNAYQIFQDSRIVAISTQAAPGASVLAKDEGLSKPGVPITPPPPMGLSPATQATQNVVAVSGPGIPQPTVRFGSTVCQ